MAPVESNVHVTYDVTWPRQVKVVTPICWGPLPKIWLEIRVGLWLRVTLNFYTYRSRSSIYIRIEISWSVTDGIGQTPCSLERYLVIFNICCFISKFNKVYRMPNILMVTWPMTRHFKEKFLPRLLGFPKRKLCRKFEVPSSSSVEDIVGSEPERISRAAKTEKIEKQSLQHAVNSARRATTTIKHS